VSNFDLKKWWTLDPDAEAASADNPLTPFTLEQRRPGGTSAGVCVRVLTCLSVAEKNHRSALIGDLLI
jgi:hypothetical protein